MAYSNHIDIDERKIQVKKIIAILLCVIIMLSLFVGCSEEFVCDWCGKTKTESPHSMNFAGEKIKVCDDCYQELKDMVGG